MTVRGVGLGGRSVRAASNRLLGGRGASLRQRRQRGELAQAIGRSRGGRTTKIHALTDAQCRPLAFVLTGGQIADCTAGAELLEKLATCDVLHGDKGYDSDAIRRRVEGKGAMPNFPPKANRKWKNCFSPFLYRNRNAIERMFCRLKDFRRKLSVEMLKMAISLRFWKRREQRRPEIVEPALNRKGDPPALPGWQ